MNLAAAVPVAAVAVAVAVAEAEAVLLLEVAPVAEEVSEYVVGLVSERVSEVGGWMSG